MPPFGAVFFVSIPILSLTSSLNMWYHWGEMGTVTKPLHRIPTRFEIAEMKRECAESLQTTYDVMIEYIGLLEDRIRVLERQNRTLRGASGQIQGSKTAKQVGASEGSFR